MTAHQLAKRLLEMPDVMVVISGYEDGVNEITGASEPQLLHLNYYEEWYYGKHSFHCYNEPCEHQTIQAIHIG